MTVVCGCVRQRRTRSRRPHRTVNPPDRSCGSPSCRKPAESPSAAAHPGRLWAHNDSGEAVLVALDARGSVTGRVRRVRARRSRIGRQSPSAPVPAVRASTSRTSATTRPSDKRITIHRVSEPSTEDSVVVKDTFHATYPDGAHDAETLLVAPDGGLFIVTKGETDAVGLYRFPRELRPGASASARTCRASRAHRGRPPKPNGSPTAPVSPDGTWVVLRTRQGLAFHRAADLFRRATGSKRALSI